MEVSDHNALRPYRDSVDERYEVAKRRNNTLRDIPAEAPRPGKWKVKAKPLGGLNPHGLEITFKRKF
jgi:hypothetical protein